MDNLRQETREELKKDLKRGDYEIISALTKGKYTAGTVKMQLNGFRNLKEPVIEATKKLIENRKRLLSIK